LFEWFRVAVPEPHDLNRAGGLEGSGLRVLGPLRGGARHDSTHARCGECVLEPERVPFSDRICNLTSLERATKYLQCAVDEVRELSKQMYPTPIARLKEIIQSV
jgi:hypothetical protein